MSRLTEVEQKWVRQAFELAERDALPKLCEQAKPFVAWCETLLADTAQNTTEISVNLALLRLQAQYWGRYEAAPVPHRNHIGTREGHTCLFQVYRHYFQQLRELHFDVNPPLLREAPPPYAPPAPQIAGVPFGILKSGDGG